MLEEWRWVPGYEGRYEVSNLGHVRSWVALGSGTRKIVTVPRPMKPTLVGPYLQVHLRGGNRGGPTRVHVAVAAAFLGPCPVGQEVRHLNGQHLDNGLANLAYGTHAENMQDLVRHGRHYTPFRDHSYRRKAAA